MEWTVGTVIDAIADAVPDRLMTICGERRSTYREAAERTTALAKFLAGKGFGTHTERPELRPWECGQDRVALIMHNDLYPDAFIACSKARVIPVNVNYHYTPAEIRELLDYVGPRGVIGHRSLLATFADALPECVELIVSVPDGIDDATPVEGAIDLDDALAQGRSWAGELPRSTPDDVVMMCTGGTTGRPKGVLWRQGDQYVVSMNGGVHEHVDEIHHKVQYSGAPWFAVSPLMHAAGLLTAFAGILNGQTAVLYDRTKFDPHRVLATIEREKVGLMTMVGDAYAVGLIDGIRSGRYDVSTLFSVASGGAPLNVEHQKTLRELLPGVILVNGYGSTETGNVAFGASEDDATDTIVGFTPHADTRIASENLDGFLEAGADEDGWVVRQGRMPLGYFKDPEATERTFLTVDGVRVVQSGDRGRISADGKLLLRGRDSLVINTGGEKVFAEEVEEVLRTFPHITDVLVVGRPSERWGSEVVAVAAGDDDLVAAVESGELQRHCRQKLAGYKIPKAVIVVDEVRRLGNGKGDYRWARAAAGSSGVPSSSGVPGSSGVPESSGIPEPSGAPVA
ncbi:AMP-binding protein [Gordonia pseudamarae]|jgi:acyl-CoA synthetase (AMP-forming)/AMP-acid ligase II|uniref:AMP-binding protein n=1 Tax=Gordonia pseudamarae TaxID=2831662 RepID=A0ABX6IDM5_9ACTN|nr:MULTISPECIES: AMP-binding protein [Gordonia]MBD0022331.1 AMP-binding protein [Gordonia sp. (in: high G+C Gram-positive bacteria)]QHN25033.1 AMP-binding protein [Gordonia pseudamarae]QHN33968.1 AMP-binding protein [Gordonia pseudamarae]